MAFLYSTGFKKHVCDTGSVVDAFDGGTIKLYSATAAPADADAALPADATLLLTYSVDGTGTGLSLDTTAVGGDIAKPASDVWKGTATTSGTAKFFRFVKSGDTGTASTTALRIQGTVGVGTADFVMASAAITAAQTYTLDYFVLSFL